MNLPPFEQCYQAALDKDARFDGWIYGGVTSTGIYCRPSCPVRTPKAANMRFYPSAAAAQSAGFRACKRCRPDAVPGSPQWDLRADLVGRAMRLIADGVIDREGVGGLADRLGYTERHVHRQMVETVGAGPLAIARANRAQTARVLLETTTLPIADVGQAAGFASVRQFNATIKEVFAETPRELRRKSSPGAGTAGAVALRLPFREPFAAAALFAFLGARAVPGVEVATESGVRRTLDLPHGPGVVDLARIDDEAFLRAEFRLTDLRDLGAAVERVRRYCDLDADPTAADQALASDRLLRKSLRTRPGLRVPGCVSGAELAMRAVLGQQVSVKGATTAAGRLAQRAGADLGIKDEDLATVFPRAEAVAALDPEDLGMPRARGRALVALAQAIAAGDLQLDGGADRAGVRSQLLELPGIGEWTADYIAMRALRDPDAFLPTDLGVRRGLEALGQDGSPAAASAWSERWRPYRAYALQHLWAIAGEAGAPNSNKNRRKR